MYRRISDLSRGLPEVRRSRNNKKLGREWEGEIVTESAQKETKPGNRKRNQAGGNRSENDGGPTDGERKRMQNGR